jgi:hypothetical protein
MSPGFTSVAHHKDTLNSMFVNSLDTLSRNVIDYLEASPTPIRSASPCDGTMATMSTLLKNEYKRSNVS